MSKVNWEEAIQPLLKKYKGKKHPLEYHNIYELLVMIVLSAQDSDKHINKITPELFEAFPTMEDISRVTPEDLFPFISTVRNFGNKAEWLIGIARQLKTDENIPLTMDDLTALKGIGRKSANVIMQEAGKQPEGVIVDLHVVRVAQRLGIATSKDPKKIEKQIMEALPRKYWTVGMDFSFLGRETCRPTNPKCEECVMNPVCAYYKNVVKHK